MDIIKKAITISKVEAIKKKDTGAILGYNIFDQDDKKYALWFTKIDNTPSKASTQFKSNAYNVGSEVGIAYSERPNNFQYKDHEGNLHEAKSTNRSIAWFSEPNELEVYARNMSQTEITDEIDVSKIPF